MYFLTHPHTCRHTMQNLYCFAHALALRSIHLIAAVRIIGEVLKKLETVQTRSVVRMRTRRSEQYTYTTYIHTRSTYVRRVYTHTYARAAARH